MKKTTELILSTSLAVATLTGCGAQEQATHPVEKQSTADVAKANQETLRELGAELVQRIVTDPTSVEEKPPYTTSIIDVLGKGAQVTYSVQTSKPNHASDSVDQIEIQQKGDLVANFDLSFLLRTDGTWNSYCQTDPYSKSGTDLDQIGEQTVEAGGRQVSGYGAAEAEAILSGELTVLDTAISDAQWQPGAGLNPLDNPCR